MKLIATGDSFISRRLPNNDCFAKEIKEWMEKGDVRFTNLEVTVHNRKGYPSPFSGGTWAMAEPSVLDDLSYYGFDIYNWANNHTMDYLFGGLLATEKELDKRGLVHAGAGKTLASAAEPRYFETAQGRVALIGATSTFHESWIGGNSNHHVQGRPGVNPLRFDEVNYVSEDQMKILKAISSQTHIDANEELNQKEGFSVNEPDGIFLFAGKKFKVAEKTFQRRTPNIEDMKRLVRSISEAKRQSDYVIVSIHSHEMTGIDKNTPADFFQEAARICIDTGAHCILGHGPHVVRGVEIYKKRPIFYSLGNFIFQNDTVSHLPQDFFSKYGLGYDASVSDGYDARSDNGKKGLGVNPYVWESIVAMITFNGDKVEGVELQPIDLGYGKERYKRGWPTLSNNEIVLQRMKQLSLPYGVDIHIEGGKGYIYL